jgi:ribonuclease-3
VSDDLAGRLGLSAVGATVDEALLREALTHRSWAAEHPGVPQNERLELLGDAVLDLAVTDALLAHDETASEGVLSRRRSQLVRESTLAAVAREVGLGADLRLGRGEAASGGREKDSLLADAVEAVVGAVFLSSGYATAAAFVLRLLGGRIEDVAGDDAAEDDSGPVDPKTALQERLAALRLPMPEYRTVGEGPDHAPTFWTEVVVAGEVLGSGSGGAKKVAEQAAAEQALRHGRLG